MLKKIFHYSSKPRKLTLLICSKVYRHPYKNYILLGVLTVIPSLERQRQEDSLKFEGSPGSRGRHLKQASLSYV